MYYLDTSLLVAALTAEPRSGSIQEWLVAREAGELFISDWVVTEFSSALSLKVRTGQLAAQQRAQVLAFFTSMAEQSFSVLTISRLDFRTAARFVEQYEVGLRSGDALHLAVAANHGLTLATLDMLMLRNADRFGVIAVQP